MIKYVSDGIYLSGLCASDWHVLSGIDIPLKECASNIVRPCLRCGFLLSAPGERLWWAPLVSALGERPWWAICALDERPHWWSVLCGADWWILFHYQPLLRALVLYLNNSRLINNKSARLLPEAYKQRRIKEIYIIKGAWPRTYKQTRISLEAYTIKGARAEAYGSN